MYKIRKITFHDHPILGNLVLDFCDLSGNACDTVIFAGENGTGKSTILNELYKVASYTVTNPMEVEFECSDKCFAILYYWKNIKAKPYMFATDKQGMDAIVGADDFKQRYYFNGIYSDVDINFHAQQVFSVTSLSLDEKTTAVVPLQIFPPKSINY